MQDLPRNLGKKVHDAFRSIGSHLSVAKDIKDITPHRCETHDCDYEGPAEHPSHVDGKKTHPNPMLHSVTVLEQHVEKLMHHVINKGESLTHHLHGSGFTAREEDQGAHERNETLKQTVARLEHKVGNLMHQLHENVKDNEFLIRNGVPRKGNEPIKHDGPSMHDTPIGHDGRSKAPSNQVESNEHDGEVNYPGGIVGSATEPRHHDKHDGEVNYPGGIVGSR